MITLDELRLQVGAERWESARRQAWRLSPATGTLEQWQRSSNESKDPLEYVRDLLGKSTIESESDTALVSLYADVYRAMPLYGFIFDLFIKRSYEDFGPDARAMFWSFSREMLSSPGDALADPVAYSMWCDFFEDPSRVDEAWRMLVTEDSSPRMLRRILDASGPVPFRLKQPLYDRLISDDSWHDSIFQSLLFSSGDVYGDFDREAAARVFSKLTLRSVEKGDIERLEAALSGKSS